MAQRLSGLRLLLVAAYLILLAGGIPNAQAAAGSIIISEFLAGDTSTLRDEDGDRTDWIEIKNIAPSALNLEGWSLTDDAADPRKWVFPSTPIPGGGFVVVFASGKNRIYPGTPLHTNFKLSNNGEYLALIQPDGVTRSTEFNPAYPPQLDAISYGFSQQIQKTFWVTQGSPLSYFIPTSDALDQTWTDPSFNSLGWGAGRIGIGFDKTANPGPLSPEITTDISSSMLNRSPTVYLRIPFQVSNRVNLQSLLLRTRYNDGFIAYLNGQRVASRNAAELPAWNSAAENPRSPSESLISEDIDLSASVDLLKTGANVLAIHLMNASASSSNALLTAELEGRFLQGQLSAARYFNPPTPGADNGPGTLTVGPRIEDIRHIPETPREDQDLVVTARILQTVKPIQAVRMEYRIMYRAPVTASMFDDGLHGDGTAGDGVYGAVIPAAAFGSGEMIRYAITALDNALVSSRDPLYPDPLNSPQYHGTIATDPRFTTSMEVIYWFIENPNDARGWGGTRCSIYFKRQFRDNILVNLHGQSSSGFPKNSFDFDLNPGHSLEWDPDAPRVDDFNLLTTYPDKAHLRNIIAYETFRDAGSPYHFVVPVRVQQNGQFWGDAHFVENGDDNYLKRLGMDTRGALYKMYNTLDTADGEKKTRKEEDNSDLQALIDGCRLTGEARKRFLFDNVNVPEVINYLATMIIIANTDCCHKNYYVYRDTEGTGEWQMLPWDVDLSFGRVWSCNSPCLSYWDDTLHPDTGLYVGFGNTLGTAIFSTPESKQMYLRRLRTLAEELLQPPGTPVAERRYEKRIDELAALISREAALDLAKWGTWGNGSASSACCVQNLPQAVQLLKTAYLEPRRAFLLQQQITSAGGEIPLAQPADASPEFGRIDFNPASGNQSQEYLELKNPLSIGMDISGWKVSGAISHTFVGGTVIPAKSSLFLSPNPRAFRSRSASPKGNEGLLVQGPYRGQLSARGESIQLTHRDGRLMRTFNYTGSPSAAQSQLRITEVMYHPADPEIPGPTVSASDFEFIELQNIGAATLNLAGVHFTNGIRFQFTGSSVTNLAPGQFVLIVRNPTAFQSRYGPGLPVAGTFLGILQNNGERLSLHDRVGEVIQDFSYGDKGYPITDGLGFSLVIRDSSGDYRSWDSRAAWRASGRQHGSPGAADPDPIPSVPIRINEILTHTDPPQLDSIELWNSSSTAVHIGGWYLTDDFKSPFKYRIPPDSFIPSQGYWTVDESQFNKTPGVPPSFSLSSTGDEAWLFAADAAGKLTGYYHGTSFGAAQNGVSFGRHLNSNGEEFFPAQIVNTLGSTNTGPLVGPVVLSEIHYRPLNAQGIEDSNLEYVELANITSTNVILGDVLHPTNTWRIRGGIDFPFPTNAVIRPGAPLLVVHFAPTNTVALTQFRNQYGLNSSIPIFGPFSGRLNNSGDTVRLYKPDPPNTNEVPYVLVDEVRYATNAPWPEAASRDGSSLQRRDTTGFGNEPTHWFAAGQTPGAPNLLNTPPQVNWISPANGASFIAPPSITLSAEANDTDGSVNKVEFWSDGELLGSDITPPYQYLWNNPPGGLHRLLARAFDNQNAIGQSILIEIVVGQPPAVTLIQPGIDALGIVGYPMGLAAEAEDLDGTVRKVQFRVDGAVVGEALGSPYISEWSVPTLGIHQISAIAVDDLGLTRTSAVQRVIIGEGSVASRVLIPQGSSWKYQDLGTDLGVAWRSRSYNDTSWKSGPAQLGYGDGDEQTTIDFGGNANSKFITTYFRKLFVVDQPDDVGALEVRVLRDDGAVVYLNTNEVFRTAMPPGDIHFETLASATASGTDETTQFYSNPISPALLVPGTNVIAVEVHQVLPSSSDVSFDLELIATERRVAPVILEQPLDLEVLSGGSAQMTVTAVGSSPLQYQWYRGNPPGQAINSAVLNTFSFNKTSTSDDGTYSVVISNTAGSARSRAARLKIVSDDADADGLPDNWELEVGLDPNRNDANEDKDGDGKSNLEEWISGTHPGQPASVLRIDSISLQGSARLIQFSAVSNRTYSVWVTGSLPPTPWTLVSELPPTATNRTARVVDSSSKPTPVFYKLEVR